MMDTLRSYVHSLSNCQAANIVNKWLYKIMLSPADRFANFLIKSCLTVNTQYCVFI
jgi:hypothetical protein